MEGTPEHKLDELSSILLQIKLEEVSSILLQISELDLTEWKKVRIEIIDMLKDFEKKFVTAGQNAGGWKTAFGGLSALSGAATVAGVLTLNPFLFSYGMIGSVGGGLGGLSTTAVKGVWSATQKRQLTQLQEKDKKLLKPFIELNKTFHDARTKVEIIDGNITSALKDGAKLGYDSYKAATSGISILNAAKDMLSPGLLPPDAVRDVSAQLIFGGQLSWNQLVNGVWLTTGAKFWASSNGLLSVASGAYDVYRGINDFTENDCSDAKKFRELREELERQRDEIIKFQDKVRTICKNKK